ncbi:MAG: FHA domain-containing protein [Clostridiales bacterium]|nr:FHA domain-containing protein [Clostridiales bacterium]
MESIKIFISHSSQNAEVAREFSSFIESLAPNIIVFCTSIDGQIRIGNDFIETIMAELTDSTVFIPLISENFLQSKFCLIELGVACSYLFGKNRTQEQSGYIYPFSVPPTSNSDALSDTPLSNLQVCRINDISAIRSFAEALEEKGAQISSGRNQRCEKYINKIDKTLDIIINIKSEFDNGTDKTFIRTDSDYKIACLEYLDNGALKRIVLENPSKLIGRTRSQVDYCIDDKKISKVHAEFIVEGGSYYVKDYNSSNGTYINGSKQRILGKVAHQIFEGDTITLADIEMTLRCYCFIK